MSGSGNKQMIINTRERLVSTDINRMQSFISRDISELLRYLFDAATTSDDSGGLEVIGNAVTNPLRAVVINGLRFIPDGTNSLSAFISPGVLGVVSPQASPSFDDSPFKWIIDPGVSLQNQIVLTANPGPDVRIDVLECSVVDTVLEVDNRDQFNPTTGLFTPISVNKASASQLTYRIRAGTPGSGFPGTASGWLPLAVLKVPGDFVTWNDVLDIWDVRPLASDFVNSPFNESDTIAHYPRTLVNTNLGGFANGIFDVTYKNRRLGGSSPILVGLTFFGVNQEPGFVAQNNKPWYLYYATPFGLPRWALYNLTNPRNPLGVRGIPIFSQRVPVLDGSGRVGSAITLPTATGLSGTTTDAVVALAGCYDNSGNFNAATVDGKKTWLGSNTGGSDGIKITGSIAGYQANFNIVEGTHHPPGARRLRCFFFTTFLGSQGSFSGDSLIRVLIGYDLETGVLEVFRDHQAYSYSLAATQTLLDSFTIEIPLITSYPSPASSAHTRKFSLSYAPRTGVPISAINTSELHVVGWDLGP